MPRRPVTIVCAAEDRADLERLSKSLTEPKQLVDRAKIILDCLQNKTNKDIAVAHKTRPNRITKWRKRFAQAGFAGLMDSIRSGRPSKSVGLKARILSLLETAPPAGQSYWDGRSIAAALGVKTNSVWEVLRKDGIQLQRTRIWYISTEKEFTTKSADIIGLYLNPPGNALVIGINEHASPLEEKNCYVEISSGKIVKRLTSTYKHQGRITLFAALRVLCGEIKTKTTTSKKRTNFQKFISDIVQGISQEQEIHVILDDCCAPKQNTAWLALHPNVKFHYISPSANWLDHVEIWLTILANKTWRGSSFETIGALITAIKDFTGSYHKNTKPFIWKKTCRSMNPAFKTWDTELQMRSHSACEKPGA